MQASCMARVSIITKTQQTSFNATRIFCDDEHSVVKAILGIIGSNEASDWGGLPMLYVSKLGKICVVCHRVADMPAPKVPSVRRKCAQCHARIWVAKGAPKGPKVCLECVTGAAPNAIRRVLKQHRLHERRQHLH